jgi:hypothetical protein
MNLELRNIKVVTWVVPEKELARDKESGCPFIPPYTTQNGLEFTIGRKKDSVYNGYNVVMFCNMVRRYINSRNEYCILTFDLNHEQTTTEPPVREVGNTCLPIEVRISLNGVVCRQIKSSEYELHIVNNTPAEIDITTSYITRKGSDEKKWHDDFAPNIKLGSIWPGAELHIKSIYMKRGRVFTDELNVFVNGQMKHASDNCNFMHNGYTGFRQPEIIDQKTDLLKVNPMITPPTYVELKIHLQPYIDPRYILSQALTQLVKDITELEIHVIRASEIEKKSIDYRSERVRITVINNDLTMITSGFDESVGTVFAANARMLGGKKITHYTAHRIHINTKDVSIRISAPDVILLLVKTVAVTKNQAIDISKSASKY